MHHRYLTRPFTYQFAEPGQEILVEGTVSWELKPVIIIMNKIIFRDFIWEIGVLRMDREYRCQAEK